MALIITREMAIEFVLSQQRSQKTVEDQLSALERFEKNNRKILTKGAKFFIRNKKKALAAYCRKVRQKKSKKT